MSFARRSSRRSAPSRPNRLVSFAPLPVVNDSDDSDGSDESYGSESDSGFEDEDVAEPPFLEMDMQAPTKRKKTIKLSEDEKNVKVKRKEEKKCEKNENEEEIMDTDSVSSREERQNDMHQPEENAKEQKSLEEKEEKKSEPGVELLVDIALAYETEFKSCFKLYKKSEIELEKRKKEENENEENGSIRKENTSEQAIRLFSALWQQKNTEREKEALKEQGKPEEEVEYTKGEGLVVVSSRHISLLNLNAKRINSLSIYLEPDGWGYKTSERSKTTITLHVGALLRLGRRSVLLGAPIDGKLYANGSFFLKKHSTSQAKKNFDRRLSEWKRKMCLQAGIEEEWLDAVEIEGEIKPTAQKVLSPLAQQLNRIRKQNAAISINLNSHRKVSKFVVPWKKGSAASLKAKRSKRLTEALHSPTAPKALVLHESKLFNMKEKIPVVVDPVLGVFLRPHQREGVQFMYDCLVGRKGKDISGCILADDMGLGKTLQVIAIVWTFLRQGASGLPLARKIVIVTPTSLVKNWVAEFKKWLKECDLALDFVSGHTKDQVRSKIESLKLGLTELLVISYDQLKIHQNQLSAISNVDMVVCDEGHKLKNANSQITMAVASVKAKYRIVMTGTPIQNDLEEFRAMVHYVNPDIVGEPQAFQTLFLAPIMRSREPDATPEEKRVGKERQQTLYEKTSVFILRRTAKVNEQYLPTRLEQSLFCRFSPMQVQMYHRICQKRIDAQQRNKMQRAEQRLLGTGTTIQDAQSLNTLTLLKKLCAHPELVIEHCESTLSDMKNGDCRKKRSGKATKRTNVILTEHLEEEMRFVEDIRSIYNQFKQVEKVEQPKPRRRRLDLSSIGRYSSSKKLDVSLSGKLTVLDQLFQHVKQSKSGDRFVVVSNFTQVLDLIIRLLNQRNLEYFKLDGSTPSKKRQELVDDFNRGERFAFLLSSKAGGVGLNLIGANRLIMVDPDWNPANDAQAMARVWRQGQTKKCYIYRTLCTGSIEEKVYQRQVAKEGLSDSIVGGNSDGGETFSKK